MFPIIHNMDSFGIFIAKRREELGLSQDQVADIAGVTKGAISKLESGHNKDPKARTMAGLSKALRIEVGSLIAVLVGSDEEIKELQLTDVASLEDAVGELVKTSLRDVLKQKGLVNE